MFFTREDILKIQQALLQLGVKDSELPSAEPVTYDDTLSIIQEGKNKQIGVKDFFNQISLWKREDFLNITDRYDEHYIMLLEAINLVPILQRKDGLVITFQDTNGDWRIYQFRGNITEFLNEEKWFDLYDYKNYIIKSFLPDEEDITALTPDENGNSFLALKDRIYDPAIFSGKGYKFVRKNIINVELATIKISIINPTTLEGDIYFNINNKGTKVHLYPTIHNTTKLVSEAIKDALVIAYDDYEVTVANSVVTLTRKYSGNTSPTTFEMYNTGVRVIVEDSTTIDEKNVITQEDINKTDTIYEIRYDFNLNGKTITIPENCVLYFTSGKFYNGNINMNNTIVSTLYEDVLSEVNINGNYYNIQEHIKNHQRQLDDKQSQIDDKQQQITANDEDISLLQTRSTQMEETIKSIAATGGASQATAVTYNNEKSKLTAINIQSAVDEVVEKTAIKDEERTVVDTPFRYIQNEEFIFAKVDAEDKLLFGIQWDGTPKFGKTSAVEDRLQSQVTLLAEKVATIMGDEDTTNIIDTMNELKKFFAEIENTQTLTSILANLDTVANNLDKTTIKDKEGNVQDTPFRVIENENFIKAIVDADDKVLFGFYRATGKPYYPQNDMYHISQSEEFLWVILDAANHPLLGIREDGSVDWAIGVPTPIQKEINNVLFKTLNLSDSVNGLSDLVEHINNSYQIKEVGKSLVKDEYHLSIDNDTYISAITDKEGKILFGIKANGEIYAGESVFNKVIKNDEYKYLIIDSDNKILFGIKNNGNIICSELNNYFKSSIEKYIKEDSFNAFKRNRYKENMLCATAKSGWKFGENFQALLVGDPHASKIAIGNAITMANGFHTIDAVIVLGDIEMFSPRQRYATFDLKWVNDTFSNKCYKKWYLVCGNHDVGADNIIHFTRTHEEVYNDMVLPMIENGCLTEGEYGTSANYSDRCYYFHDFHEKKVRLISLYEYDMPLELEDSNEYWEYVPYNSSYPLMKQAKEYVYDEANPTILNCGGYKSHSFKLKKTVKTVANASDDLLSTTMPRYKCRSVRVLSLNQINWLANVLNTTPNGYGIIIATHQPVMRNVVLTENKFSQDESFNGYNPRKNEPAFDDNADCDIITEIVNAWINKTHIIKKVSYKDTFYTTESTGGTVEYVNKLTDSDGNKYAYEVNLDFSTRTNNSSYFSCFISGHEHWDMIEYKSVYPNIYNIICPTANPKFRTGGDNPIVIKEDSVAFDCINVLSCEYGKIGLVRLGCDKTITGKDRDFEIINTIK